MANGKVNSFACKILCVTTIAEHRVMEARKRLSACPKKLSLALVWRELQVFSKLIYRGRNQHRRDRCYQKLTRVRRL